MGLIRKPPGRVTAGRALFRGRDLLAMPDRELRQIRGRDIAMIFQDPMSSLNPVLTIGLQLTEALREHQGLNDAEAERQALDMLALVGIANAPQRMRAFPHQFSGGQLQRTLFARVLLQDADLILLDEPFNAVDAKTVGDLIALIKRWHGEERTIMVVVHDLDLVRQNFPETLLLARQPVAWGETRETLKPENLLRARRFHEAWEENAPWCEPDEHAHDHDHHHDGHDHDHHHGAGPRAA
ncbi:MAG: ABC transporter ATP-binding protein [Mesorhizobium sp.]|nr:MAG: ABC transporter ATP-binding protein [Mesorhizobium sp.]